MVLGALLPLPSAKKNKFWSSNAQKAAQIYNHFANYAVDIGWMLSKHKPTKLFFQLQGGEKVNENLRRRRKLTFKGNNNYNNITIKYEWKSFI